jgi:hypothetical protein
MIYDMIYDIYLTAIGQPPGGSSTVHIYTQTVQGTSQNKHHIEQHKKVHRTQKIKKCIEQHKKYIEQHKKIHRTTQKRKMHRTTKNI